MPAAPPFTPTVYYRDPKAALAFLEAAFGFETTLCILDAEGKVAHAEMGFNGGRLIVGPARGNTVIKSPVEIGGVSTASVNLDVTDVDAHFARARAAGATIISPPTDQFYGARSYRVTDPEGHHWNVSQELREFRLEADMAGTGYVLAEPA